MTTPTPEPARAEPLGGDAALKAAVDAWDAARCRLNEKWHGGRCEPSSEAAKANIAPMIAAAIQAYAALVPASDAGLAEVERLIRHAVALGRSNPPGSDIVPAAAEAEATEHAIAELRTAFAAIRADNDRLLADAAGRGEGVEGWQPIETAPYHQEVEVRAGMMRFRAMMMPGASLDADEKPCDQWQATREGEYPPSWSEGACWESNEDLSPSLQPDVWRLVQVAAAPAPATTDNSGDTHA